MTGQVTSYGDIGSRTAAMVSGSMLKVAIPRLCMGRYGQQAVIPKNKTQSIRWRRYNPFVANTVPLQEGVTPSADQITTTDVEAVLQQFGRRAVISDAISDTHEDPVLSQVSMRMAEVAARTQELVIYNAIRGGTNVLFAGGTSRATVNAAINAATLNRAIRQLKRADTEYITQMLAASDKVATQPVRDGFVAFVHPDMQTDLEAVSGYIPVANYASGQAHGPYELGSYREIRFMASTLYTPFLAAGASGSSLLTNGGSGTGNADVYPMIIVGSDAYATVSLAGRNAIMPMVVNPKPSDSDPLGQRGHVGFKMWTIARILNDAFMVRVEAGVNQ